MVETSGDSDEEDENDSSEEETPPKNSETAKKRKVDSTSKASVPDKKAKVITPVGIVRTGGDGKKAVHTATPHPAKQVGKQRQTPKSGGSVTCKSCSRTFNSDNALQAHTKAKHGAAAK
ncbi:Histone deacetylase HDT2 [Apostasia shenzhenica]|uniref:Histone deacetylase HDT2 n=1 Tax=Apostasia shenzhenica TaxID=1088818 RepID=A0A2I0AV23_9ASPA|nr:Histone deacetylase HDT2 [Apostasia shenzhenica]